MNLWDKQAPARVHKPQPEPAPAPVAKKSTKKAAKK